MNKTQSHEEKHSNGSAVVAGVVGAVAGAGVAVAATMAMKDEKTREKVGQVLQSVKDQAMEYMDTAKDQANEQKEKAQDMFDAGKKNLQEMAHTVEGKKDTVKKEADKAVKKHTAK